MYLQRTKLFFGKSAEAPLVLNTSSPAGSQNFRFGTLNVGCEFFTEGCSGTSGVICQLGAGALNAAVGVPSSDFCNPAPDGSGFNSTCVPPLLAPCNPLDANPLGASVAAAFQFGLPTLGWGIASERFSNNCLNSCILVSRSVNSPVSTAVASFFPIPKISTKLFSGSALPELKEGASFG